MKTQEIAYNCAEARRAHQVQKLFIQTQEVTLQFLICFHLYSSTC